MDETTARPRISPSPPFKFGAVAPCTARRIAPPLPECAEDMYITSRRVHVSNEVCRCTRSEDISFGDVGTPRDLSMYASTANVFGVGSCMCWRITMCAAWRG